MANIKEAFDYAAKNPNSDFAKNLDQLASSGALNVEAKKYGLDLSPFGQTTIDKPAAPEVVKQTIPEKIAGFTGGKQIAQGLGQAIANPGIAKQQDQIQTQQFGIQDDLLKRIKEKKALGEDTSRLEGALQMITEDIQKTGQETGQLLNQKNITNKEVLGSALQLGTTIVGAGALPGAGAKVATAQTFAEGAKIGAKSGAILGGAFGASSGASQALQDNKNALDIAKGTIEGGLVGAGTGAVLGGLTGGITGKIKGAEVAKQQKAEQHALDLVSPKATTAIKEQASREGRVTEQTLLSGGKITPSNRDVQLAEAVKGVIDPKASDISNLNVIRNKVDEINTGVKAYVKTNKVPFNTNQLKTQLNGGRDELKLVFASDSNAQKTYDALVKEFMKHVESKDTAGLLDARQAFDKLPAVKKLLDSQGLGENVKKEIALTVRSQANKYIASLLPEGNAYRSTLLKESKMIEAIGNIAGKNADTIGVNKLQQLAKEYPAIKFIVGSAVVGLVGAAGVGVGGAIINSTD